MSQFLKHPQPQPQLQQQHQLHLLAHAVKIKINLFLNVFYFKSGTFISYDPVNGLNEPSINGFSAGKFQDGTEAYVGFGDNSGCGGQNPCPGRRNFGIKIIKNEFADLHFCSH